MIYLICSRKIINKFTIASENIGLQIEKFYQIKLYYYVNKRILYGILYHDVCVYLGENNSGKERLSWVQIMKELQVTKTVMSAEE